MNKIIVILILTVSLLTVSCVAPQKLITISPVGDNYKFHNGRKVIEMSDNNIKIQTSYYGKDGRGNFLFSAIIENNSTESVLIEPSKIYMSGVFLEKHFKRGEYIPVKKSRKYFARDPEIQIAQLENSMDYEKSSNTAKGTLSFVATVLTVGSGKYDDKITDDMQQDEIQHEQKMSALAKSIDFWRNYSIRKTELSPGQSINGLIAFQRNDGIGYCTIGFPVSTVVIEFDYKREKL